MFSNIVTGIIDMFLPDLCRSCGDPVLGAGSRTGICKRCYSGVMYIQRDRWCRCGRTLFADGSPRATLCGKCIRSRPAYDRLISLCEYEGPVRLLLHRLKYQGDTSVLPALQSIKLGAPDPSTIASDLVIPVPLHRKRLQSRGLNQSLCLARLWFGDDDVKITPFLLRRHMNARPQTGLSLAERRKNLRNVFSLNRDAGVSGRKICLVDDVFTTGSTVQECSMVLKRAGAEEVTAVVFAMTIRADQRLV